MPKLTWNNFISKHTNKNTFAFSSAVSPSLTNGMVLDKNGLKLPTPYKLFTEWCSAYLSGDWATIKVKGGFIVVINEKGDGKMIQDEFKIIGKAKITKASNNTFPIGYKDSQYSALAGDLGYVL